MTLTQRLRSGTKLTTRCTNALIVGVWQICAEAQNVLTLCADVSTPCIGSHWDAMVGERLAIGMKLVHLILIVYDVGNYICLCLPCCLRNLITVYALRAYVCTRSRMSQRRLLLDCHALFCYKASHVQLS